MQLEGAQLPRVLNDPQVTVAIISTTYIQQINLSPTKDSILLKIKVHLILILLLQEKIIKKQRMYAILLEPTSHPKWQQPLRLFLKVVLFKGGKHDL